MIYGTSLFCTKLHIATKLMLLMTILQTKQKLYVLPMMHHFISTRWASARHDLGAAAVHSIYLHVHVAVPFQLQWTL